MAPDPASQSTLTFLFTDIEGSTRRWETNPTDMGLALAQHDSMLQHEITRHGGTIFKHTGDGCVAVFRGAGQAISASVAIQRAFAGESLRLRIGIHSGSAEERDGDYFGPTLNRAPRLLGAGHGGQILVSDATAALGRSELDPELTLIDLGEHRLRDLQDAERIHQVAAADLDTEFPPLKSESWSLGRLPATRTSLIGRAASLDELERLCAEHRLVTLTGVGGTGKTRLAIALAGRLQEGLRDGASFVDLAPVADPASVPRAVAEAVGMPQVAGQAIDEDLAVFLERVQAVVVLDNCEHVLDAAADLVDLLMERAPELRLLVTSREALGVDGEHNWRVPSLAVEADGATAPAVSLFLDRAEAAGAIVDRDPATLATVGEIVTRLDGIPLAIELAAVRAAHLTPGQILEMLDDRFVLLGGGRRRARQRQATLQAAVDWSYDLLEETEQQLLRRLAVFSGTFSADAAAAICVEGGSVATTLATVTALVDKSLVVAVQSGSTMRFRLLETIRLYSQEKLVAAGEAPTMRDRHRDHFLEWAESVTARELGPEPTQAIIEPEADNVRAAIDWSLDHGRPDLVVRQVVAVAHSWFRNLRADEADAWLAETAEAADHDLDPETRIAWHAARMLFAMDRIDGLAIGRWINETLETSPETPSSWRQIVWALVPMMVAATAPDDVDGNLQLVATSRDQLARNPVRWLRSMLDYTEADVLLVGGRIADAIPAAQRGRDDPDGDEYFTTMLGGFLTIGHHLLGHHETAVALSDELLTELPERTGRFADLAVALVASVTRAGAGDRDESRRVLRRQLDMVQRRYTHIDTAIGIPILNAAVILALEGRQETAATVLSAAGRYGLNLRWEGALVLHREYSRRLHAQLGDEAFLACMADAETLTPTDLEAITREVAAS